MKGELRKLSFQQPQGSLVTLLPPSSVSAHGSRTIPAVSPEAPRTSALLSAQRHQEPPHCCQPSGTKSLRTAVSPVAPRTSAQWFSEGASVRQPPAHACTARWARWHGSGWHAWPPPCRAPKRGEAGSAAVQGLCTCMQGLCTCMQDHALRRPTGARLHLHSLRHCPAGPVRAALQRALPRGYPLRRTHARVDVRCRAAAILAVLGQSKQAKPCTLNSSTLYREVLSHEPVVAARWTRRLKMDTRPS